jgi:hypothetical protein
MPEQTGLGNSLLAESGSGEKAGLGSDELMENNGEGGLGMCK